MTAEPAPVPAPPATPGPPTTGAGVPEPDDFEGTSRWVDASAEVRSTAKWIATAVAGVGAVIFGAGPILARTELDASSWPFLRVVACVAAAVVGVLGLVLLINALLRAQMPVELNLATLPDTFKQQVAADPSAYLPGNCLTVDEFRTRLRGYQTAAVRLPEQVEAANRDDDKASLQRALAAVDKNLALYRRRRSELLAQGVFAAASERVVGQGTQMGWGAVIAVAGSVVYLLLVSGKSPDEAEADAAAAPDVAVLHPYDDNEASRALWAEVGLDACVVPPPTTTTPTTAPTTATTPPTTTVAPIADVTVLRHDGQGTPDDPYVVETLGLPEGCPRVRFAVIDSVALLTTDDAEELTISYEEDDE